MKKYLILFCIPLTILFFACKQTRNEQNSSWNISGDAFSIIDTSQVIGEKHPLYLRGYMSMASMRPIIFVQNRLFEIPKPSKEIKISVNTKNENIGNDFIKHSVSRGECKLILLEMPLYRSVRCELFVQGLIDEGEIEDIKCEIALKAAFEEENEFAEVLQALREYNLHHEEKVHILGMDTLLIKLSLDIRNSARDLIAAFINSGNKEKMLPVHPEANRPRSVEREPSKGGGTDR